MPIVNNTINAIAMTVLPDAPIDPATGLRVPTIAVATGGGVSVIKHDGTVVNSSSTSNIPKIAISKDNRIYVPQTSAGNWWHYSAIINSLAASFPLAPIRPTDSPYNTGWSATPVQILSNAPWAVILAGNNPSGISLLRHPPSGNGAKTSNVRISSSFNTGWMTGDIRRAYLSDVTAEAVAANIQNEDFSSYADNAALRAVWSSGTPADISLVGGKMQIAVASTWVARSWPTVIGRVYRISVTVASGVSPTIRLGSSVSGTNYGQFTATPVGTVRLSFLATGTNFWASAYASPTLAHEFSSFVLEEVVADRSYKAALANITGTLTKSQLASGTSLVGYSGFSASNYLREPYSADLDFGTGEFTASAWVNVPVTIDPATRALGPELLADPSLDTPASWALNTGVSMTGGQIIFSSVGSTLGAYSVANISSAGRVYAITIVVSAITAGQFRIRMASGALVLIPASSGTYTIYCTSDTGASGPFSLLATGTTSGVVDSITVKEVSNCFIFDRAFSSGPRLQLLATPAGNLSAVAFDGTTTRTVTTTAAYNTETWLKARVRYTTDGSLAILVNGREVAVTRGAPLLTMNNSSAVLTIGNSYALDAPFPGSIALLKLGATVPTNEQGLFMCEQEKQLFRAGAQSVLPDSGSILDMAYDDATDRWVAVSGTNESYWTGLVRNNVVAVPAGTYTRIVATSGVELNSRVTTNPGVDVSIPAYGLREELVRRAEAASRLGKELATYDYVGGFTGNITTGSTAIASVAGLTYPTSYIGARISGTGIPANTTIVAVSGTTIYISAAATATTSTLSITFLDFILPAGMEAKTVMSAGAVKQEGSTKDYTRLYDGFLETIRFAAAPGATTWVQIQAQRISQ